MKEEVFQIGDYVRRKGTNRTGVVVSSYGSRPDHIGDNFTQYAVQWDDTGEIGKSYLAIGLERAPLSTGGLSRG